jgi:hypothetical protein
MPPPRGKRSALRPSTTSAKTVQSELQQMSSSHHPAVARPSHVHSSLLCYLFTCSKMQYKYEVGQHSVEALGIMLAPIVAAAIWEARSPLMHSAHTVYACAST